MDFFSESRHMRVHSRYRVVRVMLLLLIASSYYCTDHFSGPGNAIGTRCLCSCDGVRMKGPLT